MAILPIEMPPSFHRIGKNRHRHWPRSNVGFFLNTLQRQSAEAGIARCAEVGIPIKIKRTVVPIYDTAWLHIEAAVEFAVS